MYTSSCVRENRYQTTVHIHGKFRTNVSGTYLEVLRADRSRRDREPLRGKMVSLSQAEVAQLSNEDVSVSTSSPEIPMHQRGIASCEISQQNHQVNMPQVTRSEGFPGWSKMDHSQLHGSDSSFAFVKCKYIIES